MKKRRAKVQKARFTRHVQALHRHIDRWQTDPVSDEHEEYGIDLLSQVQEDQDQALEIYKCIKADDNVSKQMFSNIF